jgi:hypothetical protein
MESKDVADCDGIVRGCLTKGIPNQPVVAVHFRDLGDEYTVLDRVEG